MILFCPSYDSDSYPVLAKSQSFAINILAANQSDIAYTFAKKGEAKQMAIKQIDIQLGNFGTPVIFGSATTLECSMWKEYEGGDHAIIIGNVENIHTTDSVNPMVYCSGKMTEWKNPDD